MPEPEVYIPRDTKSPIYIPTCMDILVLYYTKGNSRLKADRTFYNNLKEKFPQLKKYTDHQICAHLKGFNSFVADTIISYRDGVTLPANMGLVMICTMGRRTKAIDHNKSAKMGVKVYHKNDHSEGYGGGLYYSSTQTPEGKTIPERMYSNCEYWTMTPSRKLEKRIEKAYKTNWKFFNMLPKSRRYADMIPTYQKTLKTKKVIKEIKDSYDEFDFGK